MASKFDVVISGMSGRFPDCDDIVTFKKKLYDSESFISSTEMKWSSKYKFELGEHPIPWPTGKFTSVAEYDPMVFKMSGIVGRSSDITNSKVMEPSFEAIIDAGINPYSLSGENVGVFMSCGINECDNRVQEPGDKILGVIGCSKTMLSNRLSFAFDFTGPSVTYNCDPLGSIKALEKAYNDIADGCISAAIVGACSNLVIPTLSLLYSAFGFVSPDGLCRAFDKEANGYGRSECCILLFLQKFEDAKRNYGTIKLCDIIYKSIVPLNFVKYSEDFLKAAFEKMYARNKSCRPSDICFVEMNAGGVKQLDMIESNAVADFFCQNRSDPLLVGSIKSNLGHTEATSFYTSLVKGLLALDSDVIAPNLNFRGVNEEIRAFKDGKLKVVDQPTPLPGDTIAVNTIGLIEGVEHVVIQQNPIKPEETDNTSEEEQILPQLLLICGRTMEDLRKAIEKVQKVQTNRHFVSMFNDVFAINMPSHIYRGYTLASKSAEPICDVETIGERNRPIWFLYSGMGSQWNCMGLGLLDIPIFADAVKRCDAVLQPRGIDIYKILMSEDPTIFDDIINAFVGIITIQVGLTEILKSLGMKPDGIIGHSVGENGCAYADGCLTIEQAVMASYARGVASTEVQTIKGMMAAIGKGYNQIKDDLPETVQIACHNSAENCTLTGPADDVNEFVELLRQDGIFAKAVNVANIAYHSKYIAPAGKGLQTRLSEVIQVPQERSPRWISTSIPESDWDKPLAKYCSAEYLTNNLLSPVLFEEGCKHIPKNALVIEIAPHGLLQTILKRSLPQTCTNVSLTLRSKNKENLKYLFTSVGKLYIAGCEPDVNALYPKVTYPAPRGTPPISLYATWEHEMKRLALKFSRPEPAKPLSAELIKIRINDDSKYYYLRFHKIMNRIIIPPSFFLYLTWWMLALTKDEKLETMSVIFEDIKMHKNLSISLKKPRSVSIMIQAQTNFEVVLQNENKTDKLVLIMSGKIAVEHDDVKVGVDESLSQKSKLKISSAEFYNHWQKMGYSLSDSFVNLQEITYNGTDYHGKITWNENWITFLDSLMKFYIFSCVKDKSKLIYPATIKKLFISPTEFMQASTGDDILCHLDVSGKTARCKGIEMKEIECKRFPKTARNSGTTVQLEGFQFIPHASPCCPNIEEFLKFCLQLIIDNCTTTENEDKVIVFEKVPEYRKSLQKVIKENLHFQSKIMLCSAEEILTEQTKKNRCLFVISENNVNLTECKCENVFLLLISTKSDAVNLDVEKSYLEISKQSFSNTIFTFLKKKPISNGHPAPVYVECENLSVSLDSKLTAIGDGIVLIRRNVESDDIPIILGNSKKSLRFLYWLSNEKNSLKSMEKLFKKQLDLHFRVNIFKNGEFGSYRNISRFLSDGWNDKNVEGDELSPTDILIESADVKYYHSDIVTENLEGENYTCGIEYSGIDQCGKRIMGLARYNQLEPLTPMDPYLTWRIPSDWSLEDAATVPFIFTQTYRIMDVITDQGGRIAETLLINRGKEKRMMDAFISLSLAKKCAVFVTVSDENEAKDIKSKFPQLKDFQILNEDKCLYEIQLRSIKKGVDVVVNCLPGVEHITACLNCVTEFGRYIQVGNQNIRDVQLGLYSFLKSVSFSTIPNTIISVLNLNDEEKKSLKINVEKEIKNNGAWLKCRNFLKSEAKPIAHRNTDLQITKNLGPNLRFDRNRSYIIIAGDRKCSSWCELVEWLITKGARKFIVAIHNFGAVSKYSHQMNRWLSQPNISIILSSAQKIDSFEKANELVANAEKQAPLGAVFFILMESASKKIQSMDSAVQSVNPNVPFISLLSGGLKECEDRKFSGAPSVVLHSDNTEKLSHVLPLLEDILSRQDNNNSPTLYKIVDRSSFLDKESLDFLLRDYIPNDMKILEAIAEGLTEALEFQEVTSLSLRYDQTQGVYPIFVLPALHISFLQPLISRLFYPVFSCTVQENTRPIAEMAEDLLKAVSRIQPTGPITIIGETWNSILAIELISLLEREKRKFKLFLLEGNPKDWSERLTHVVLTPKFENNLIKHIFSFADVRPDTIINNDISFEDSVKNYLSKLPRGNVNADNVIKTVETIRDRLIMAAHHKFPNNILNNVTLFTRHLIDEKELKLSITSDVTSLPECNYEEFIRDSRISKIINEKAVYDWWDYSIH